MVVWHWCGGWMLGRLLSNRGGEAITAPCCICTWQHGPEYEQGYSRSCPAPSSDQIHSSGQRGGNPEHAIERWRLWFSSIVAWSSASQEYTHCMALGKGLRLHTMFPTQMQVMSAALLQRRCGRQRSQGHQIASRFHHQICLAWPPCARWKEMA